MVSHRVGHGASYGVGLGVRHGVGQGVDHGVGYEVGHGVGHELFTLPEGVVKACYGLVELHQNCVHIAKGVVPHLKVVIIFSIKMNVLLILLDHGQPPPRAPATTISKHIMYGQEPENLRSAKS